MVLSVVVLRYSLWMAVTFRIVFYQLFVILSTNKGWVNLSRDFREPVDNCLKSVNLCRLGSKPFSQEVKSVRSCLERKLILSKKRTRTRSAMRQQWLIQKRKISLSISQCYWREEEKSEGEIQCKKKHECIFLGSIEVEGGGGEFKSLRGDEHAGFLHLFWQSKVSTNFCNFFCISMLISPWKRFSWCSTGWPFIL